MRTAKGTDGKTYEVLCRCVNGMRSIEYNKINIGISSFFYDGGKYDRTCPLCGKFYYYDPTKPLDNKTPRKHAELIKQWADDDSLEIEIKHWSADIWITTETPEWLESREYRIKPKQRKLKPLRECLCLLIDNSYLLSEKGNWHKVSNCSVEEMFIPSSKLISFDPDFDYPEFLLKD